MRLEIRYTTTFDYPDWVRDSHNVLRACPATDGSQTLESYALVTDPPARVISHTDYWGTRLDSFGIVRPHRRLTVLADSIVQTRSRPVPDTPVPLTSYEDGGYRADHWQYLAASPHARWSPELQGEAAALMNAATDAAGAVNALIDDVRGRLDYQPGATYVGVDVNEVLEQGKGVCQDFAHALIAMARSVGIPARYVSGYLYAADQEVGRPPQQPEIEVQTHAWVEIHVPRWGWWAVDPTNGVPVGEHHVKIGHGRDYGDVAPLRGVYHGPEDHELGVSVHISREQMSAFQSQQ